MKTASTEPLSGRDHELALAEVSFLLETFAMTLDDLMGGATASVGRIAGRQAARKIPVHLPEPTVDNVLAAIAERLHRGFALSWDRDDQGGAVLHFGTCAIRDLCRARGRDVGGPICGLFHHYLDGMVNEFLQRPTRSAPVMLDGSCDIRLEVK